MAVAAWIVLVPAMFPGTVLAAAGGMAFGALGGSVLALVGAAAGGLVAFAVARFGAREAVERLAERKPRLARAQALLARGPPAAAQARPGHGRGPRLISAPAVTGVRWTAA